MKRAICCFPQKISTPRNIFKSFFSQDKVAAAAGTTLARTTAIATAVGPSAVHPTTSSDRPDPMEASFPFSLSQNSIMLFRSEHLQFITSSRFPFAGVICHSAVRLLFFHCSLPFSSIAPCPFLPLLPALFFHCSLPFSSIAPCPFLDFLVFCNLLVSLSHLSDNLSMWRSYAMFVLWSNQTFCFNVYFLWWGIILLHMSGVRLRCHVALTFVLQEATGAVVAAMASNLSPMSFPGTFAS